MRVNEPEFDELSAASLSARHIGAKPPIVQEYGDREALESYPRLIEAAEAPVIDTACGALLKLAERVHANGQKVVLTGEGADEWLVGYPWYKAAKLMGFLDAVPGVNLSDLARRCYLRLNKVPHFPPEWRERVENSIGGQNAWIDSYGLLAISKLRFYSEQMREVMNDSHPWGELGFPLEKAKRWAPLNRGIWMAARVLLAGHLLQAKGDRVSMHSSVEVRYPFLDEEVFDFTAKLHPRWKLRGFRDKYLLRLLAERWIPKSIARRGKVIFRAPLDSFHMDPEPPFVAQLLSEDSLRRTGYFDVKEVTRWRKGFRVNCGRIHCRDSPWKWDSPRSSPPSSGTINSWAAAWPICPSGPATKSPCKWCSASRHHPSFCNVCCPISFISGSSLSLLGIASPF